MPRQPTIAVTAGDPCGIGPEVILKTLARGPLPRYHSLLVIGDEPVFAACARRLRLPLPWRSSGSTVSLLECGHQDRFVPGRSSAAAGKASLRYLEEAVKLWRAGRIQALVTAPVTKWAIQRSTPSFVGQTEYLASAMGVREVAMMFVSDRLRIVLLTRHVPLREVARAVTPRTIASTLRLTACALREQFHRPRPRLAICGLNPHAGESGGCGKEEQRVLEPALRTLRRQGLRCDGPFAADGFFAAPHRYDAVVCWYHDQGLIPFKMAARDRGCQLTLGLPIVRTSPDHGSALDIAGRGIADPGSLRYALSLASLLAHRLAPSHHLSLALQANGPPKADRQVVRSP